MSSYPIQFQTGMSWTEFMNRFGTERQCIEQLQRQCWPGGFERIGPSGAPKALRPDRGQPGRDV